MKKNKAEIVPENPEDLVTQFSQTQDKNEFLEILGKLFERDNIELITELSDDEIKLVTRIKTIAELKDIKVYKTAIQYFLELKLSKNRKSRHEIVDAVKGYMQGMNSMRRGLGGLFGKKEQY